MTVLVAGATGVTGSTVVEQLVDAGIDTRALTRSPDNAARLTRPGVDVAVASFDDDRAMRVAFAGVTAAYIVTPSATDMARTEGIFAMHAARAGAHLVKLSVIGASVDSRLRFGRHHAESEAAIEEIGGSWTFVQPTGFMQNDLAWAAQIPTGTIAAPAMDAAWSIVDVRDVAAVAVAALIDPTTHRGRRLAVTGPEARTPRDRIEALGATIGRPLEPFAVGVDDAKQQMRSFGMDDWSVDGIGELLDLYATGIAADVSPDVESVLGRPPRRWEEFINDHLDRFG